MFGFRFNWLNLAKPQRYLKNFVLWSIYLSNDPSLMLRKPEIFTETNRNKVSSKKILYIARQNSQGCFFLKFKQSLRGEVWPNMLKNRHCSLSTSKFHSACAVQQPVSWRICTAAPQASGHEGEEDQAGAYFGWIGFRTWSGSLSVCI